MADNIGQIGSATKSLSIGTVKSDTADLDFECRAIHANTDGLIKVLLVGDTTPSTYQVLAGLVYAKKIKRVYDTGTNATGYVEA
jgi:hypothetical protein